jgi:glycosyltransferase involved in cell wall biosynthesis
VSDVSGSVGAPDRITVCICTFKRAVLLEELLDAVAAQVSDGSFTFDVVVIDNDVARSAKPVVDHFAQVAGVSVTYDCEPERNISKARNRAVALATGAFVAFIDDDERPVPDWLMSLHRCRVESGADGVLGPVVADFPSGAPAWLSKGRFFERPRHRTGTRITASDARTGNVLLARSLFQGAELWFDPAFGRSGGEDSDFFARKFAAGATFVWCDEAVAYETVPPERWTIAFHIKRLWRAGTIDGEWIREGRIPGPAVVAKNLLVLAGCAALIPPSLVLPKHARVRVAQKLAYCGGLVTASLGFSLLRDRE